MPKMARLLFILNKLDKGEVTTKQLAQDMEVSDRTVQRYINEIDLAQFPIVSPKLGTYTFQEGYSLSRMQLTNEEASLLVLINSFVQSLKNKSLIKSFKSLKNRIIDNKSENPFFIKSQESTEYPINDITKKLEEFIKNKECISIEYEGNNKVIWNLKPLKIAYFEGFWYLLCLGMENKIIKFAIPKIKIVTGLEHNFKCIKNLDKILKESLNVWFDIKRDISVQLLVSKDVTQYFKSKDYFPLQKTIKENKDGSLVLSCKISRNEEIFPVIFRWIPYVKVLEPKSLAEKMSSIIKKYIQEN